MPAWQYKAVNIRGVDTFCEANLLYLIDGSLCQVPNLNRAALVVSVSH